MRRNPILVLLAISIVLIAKNIITEEEPLSDELHHQEKSYFLMSTFSLFLGVLTGLSVGNIILFIYTHL
jgi:hypothetical protein